MALRRSDGRRGNYAAFVAPRMRDGRVMVVQNRQTGEWMMPGGMAEHNEAPRRTAAREMREETGYRPKSPLRFVTASRRGISFFETKVDLPRNKKSRRRQFDKRYSRDETSDYGFVDPRRSTLVVTDVTGRRKRSKPTSFRKGTASQLRAVS